MTSMGDGSPPEDAYWPEDVARLLGVKRSSVKHYVQQARAAQDRRAADPTLPGPEPGDFPPPDGTAARRHDAPGSPTGQAVVETPWWHKATIDGWLPHRRPRGNQHRRAPVDTAARARAAAFGPPGVAQDGGGWISGPSQ